MLVRKQVRKHLIVMGALFLIVLGTIIGGKIYYYTRINGYPDTANFSQRIHSLKLEDSSRKTILVFHKPGCPDCLAARSTIKSELRRNSNKVQGVVINTNNPKSKQYLAEYGVTKVPTIIYLQGDQVVDSTTSISDKEIKRVMRGNS